MGLQVSVNVPSIPDRLNQTSVFWGRNGLRHNKLCQHYSAIATVLALLPWCAAAGLRRAVRRILLNVRSVLVGCPYPVKRPMRYQNVCIESLGYTLPDEIVTSAEIEHRLEPLYRRLKLPEGRLELMTGIAQRRFWPRGTLPSDPSVASARSALNVVGLDREYVGALVHASVCRDHLEPATACRVHHLLGLAPQCMIYDVSNACLGILNGMVQVANMIELGQIRAGLVVGTESGRYLVENTIAALNANHHLTRRQIKTAVASLTIGSASCAVLLVDRRLSRTQNRLVAAMVRTHTSNHRLCHSGRDEAVGSGMQPLMETDAEKLMHEGIRVGAETFPDLLAASGWSREDLDRTFCHQVGGTHRKLMLEALGLDEKIDFATLEWLGNTGSAALPVTMAVALDQGLVRAGDRIGLLGIGSGINCLMLGAQWQRSLVGSGTLDGKSQSTDAVHEVVDLS
jgi:acyl-CoA:acyl-CoA alkyltransferase